MALLSLQGSSATHRAELVDQVMIIAKFHTQVDVGATISRLSVPEAAELVEG
jgi:hypothetical protein